MRILITGGTGMMGRRLARLLRGRGHEVWVVSRKPRRAGEISWESEFPEADAALHLAGRSVAEKRWTKEFCEQLRASRVETAKKLRAKLTPRCQILITASGANAYPFGDTCGAPADEHTPLGDHFSGRLCREWEGVWEGWHGRVVALRIGFVIGADDAGIRAMLPFYRACLGGVIGSGRQRMSWIAVEDLMRIFLRALEDETLRGAVNAVAPNPISFEVFNFAFARAVGRPAPWDIPGWAMRLLYGAMADEFILADYPVVPAKLLRAGFQWEVATIDEALKRALTKS